MTMLEHGKAVLCEKPIGLTGGQAEEMADFAKEMVCIALDLLNPRCHVRCSPCSTQLPLHAKRRPTAVIANQHDVLQGLFLVEGHWDRFFPATQAVRAAVKRGLIGKCVLNVTLPGQFIPPSAAADQGAERPLTACMLLGECSK